MSIKRSLAFGILFALCSLALPVADVAAHGGGGGGGGGGGHGGGGGGGGSHGSWGGGGGRYSGASFGGAHYGVGYSGGARYSGAQSANYHAGNGNFNHSGNWNNGNWNNGHHDWDHYFNNGYGRYGYGYGGYGWGWGWGWGIGGWGGWGWGYPYGWDSYYSDYFCPYGAYYSAAYPAADYGYDYSQDGQNAGQYAMGGPEGQYSVNAPPAIDPAAQAHANEGQGAPDALQYYNEARTAFEQSNYHDALRLAGHSGVESPQNPKVHELTSLALFASGDYRGAATEAHAALALGPPSSWADLYSYYNDNKRYTDQLRKLEKTVATVPKSAPAHFLLGYHYLMTGATADAKEQFAAAAKLTPNDKLAQHIVKQLEAGNTVTPPELPKPPAAGNAEQKSEQSL